jgi:hypothetical protein
MEDFPQNIWRRLRHTADGRRLAGGLIAGAIGASTAAGISPNARDVIIYAVAGAIMGSMGVSILEWRDRRRAAKRRENESAPRPLVGLDPSSTLDDEPAKAEKREPLSFLERFAIAAGAFFLLCGAAMAASRALGFLAHK